MVRRFISILVQRSIVIPSSVVIWGKESFSSCKALESATFASGSRLERIEESAFSRSGLKSIVIPASVAFLGKDSFHPCEALESVTFENGSRMERIEESALSKSGLKSGEIASSIEIPNAIEIR
jgi:hypothetical protein